MFYKKKKKIEKQQLKITNKKVLTLWCYLKFMCSDH